MKELSDVIKGSNVSLKEIWSNPKLKEVEKEIRKYLQEKAISWAVKDHKKHPAVYISNKPKRKLLGLYYQKSRGNGSIVIFPIRVTPVEGGIAFQRFLSLEEMMETLKHEYSHHLAQDIPHGNTFKKAYDQIRKRK